MRLRIALLLFVAAAENDRSFTVYDNMFYRGKPNTDAKGVQGSNILYENLIPMRRNKRLTCGASRD
jgi:hypothetical protein